MKMAPFVGAIFLLAASFFVDRSARQSVLSAGAALASSIKPYEIARASSALTLDTPIGASGFSIDALSCACMQIVSAIGRSMARGHQVDIVFFMGLPLCRSVVLCE
jgi:hypothetical protein